MPGQAAAALTTTTLALSSGSVATGTVFTFTATVSNGAPVTAGTVTFCNASATYCADSAVIGRAQLAAAGTAIIRLVPGIGVHLYEAVFSATTANAASNSSLAPQPLVVTGHYSCDTLYPESTSNAVNLAASSAPDFAVTSSTATQTIAAGASADDTFNIAPSNGFVSTVALTETGLPTGATATFAPASVTPNGAAVTFTLTIKTAVTAANERVPSNRKATSILALNILSLPVLGIVLLGGKRKNLSRMIRTVVLGTLTLGRIFTIAGCGTGSSGGGTSNPTTYTVTITATGGSLTHATTVKLIVD